MKMRRKTYYLENAVVRPGIRAPKPMPGWTLQASIKRAIEGIAELPGTAAIEFMKDDETEVRENCDIRTDKWAVAERLRGNIEASVIVESKDVSGRGIKSQENEK